VDRVDQVYEVVKQKILDLEVDPMQPLDENALVRETGGSMTILGQALQRLAGEGLVAKERRRWRVTRAATAATLAEIFDVRRTLEGMCVRFAAERASDEHVERMERALKDFERVIQEGDNQALLAVDRKFHQQLYEASGNRFLARALDDMYTLIYRLSYFALDRVGSMRSNVEEHRDILDAVRSGDGRTAERLIQEHITHFQRMVEPLL
jgi:DNA-binding GntR family transcriptional regulator